MGVGVGFWLRNLRERDHLEELGVDGSMDWIDLAQNRDRWRAVLNAVIHL